MARTTNSDALPHVSSRYELSMLSTQRVRDLAGGATPVIDDSLRNDKPPVIALREIASGKLDIDELRHTFVQSHKTRSFVGDDIEGSIESKSEDPALRELDAELEQAIVATEEMPAEELTETVETATMDAELE